MLTPAVICLFSDGGARRNPGPAGIGFVLTNEGGAVLEKKGHYIGRTTNNIAEYTALLEGLKAAGKYSPRKVVCFLDSQLVVNQLNGSFRVKKKHLLKFVSRIKALENSFPAVEYRFIPRQKNKEADRLVNEAIDTAATHKAPL